VNNPSPSAFRGPVHTVFLDRDGVINEKMPEGRYVTRWDEFHLLPDVVQAIAMLNRAGVRVVVVSNQRGVALGLYSPEDVRALHAQLQQELARSARVWTGSTFARTTKACASAAKPLGGMFEQRLRNSLRLPPRPA